MKLQNFLRCALALALTLSVFAQTKPPTGSGGGVSTPPRGLGTSAPPNPIPNAMPNVSPDTIQRPNYITGKVMLEDGRPLPEPVPIQLVCRANPHTIGYTDGKGTFGMDLNDKLNRTMFADASETATFNGNPNGNPNSTVASGTSMFSGQYMGCDVQAQLPGFRSDVIHLDARRSMDNPEIGTIILHRLANVDGLTISATTQMAPKDAKKAYDKGKSELDKKKPDEAQKDFEKAVSIYPKFAVAWFELGMIQVDKTDMAGARHSFEQALAADPKYVNPYLELAIIAMKDQNLQEAADLSGKMVKLNPVDFPRAWMINALSNFYLKNLDVAEKSAKEGIARDTGHHFPVMHRVLAVIQAQRQDYKASAQNLRDYLKFAPNATDTEEVKKQLADVEKVAGPEAAVKQ